MRYGGDGQGASGHFSDMPRRATVSVDRGQIGPPLMSTGSFLFAPLVTAFA